MAVAMGCTSVIRISSSQTIDLASNFVVKLSWMKAILGVCARKSVDEGRQERSRYSVFSNQEAKFIHRL